jgi:hypothetical protein
MQWEICNPICSKNKCRGWEWLEAAIPIHRITTTFCSYKTIQAIHIVNWFYHQYHKMHRKNEKGKPKKKKKSKRNSWKNFQMREIENPC